MDIIGFSFILIALFGGLFVLFMIYYKIYKKLKDDFPSTTNSNERIIKIKAKFKIPQNISKEEIHQELTKGGFYDIKMEETK